MRALVMLNGDVGGSDRWLAALAAAGDLTVAADGAAAKLAASGVRPDVVVGDLDSLSPRLRAELERGGVAFEVHTAAKDKTDAELAIDAAIRRGADEIVVVGAFGGPRLDHAVANLMLLGHEEFAAVDVSLVTAASSFRSLLGPGTLTIEGRPADYVTLAPLSEIAHGVRTDGLRYPLHGEDLVRGSSRGVSNELTDRNGSVELKHGLLLVATQRRSVVPD